ncbi:trypsin-like peptidase domain-containing protein [Patescibacteria group bacterium]|nr:trypsin-like peptidase domain-containing protein [Patescibacteria group bacterium]
MLNSESSKFLGPKEEKKTLSEPQPKALGAKRIFWLLILIIFISSLFGFLAGIFSLGHFYLEIKNFFQKLNVELPEPKIIEREIVKEKEYLPQTNQEQAIIGVVKEVSSAVVSIVITKNLPVIEKYYIKPFEEEPFQIPQYRQRIEKKEIGGGSGFIVSEEGMILTNRHVVEDKEAEYTVLTNDGRSFEAKVLARDPGQDLAIIKIEGGDFSTVGLDDSSNLQIGQTVIAIGNALGEFKNTVSVGVISGLGRTVTASGGGLVEILEDVIQTDAAINKGNSGGPLLNLKGEVIGINTAMALGAENIGFAVPINKAKRAIEQVKTLGKIVYPFLGIRYILITDGIQRENDLPVNYGVWIKKGERGEPAIFPGSAAEEVGLKENDILLEFNNEKITPENSLAKIIMKYNPGDKVILKILRNGEEKTIEATLGERSE